MTSLYLQDYLKQKLEELLKLQSTAHETGFNVYMQNLPPPTHAKDDTMFPYCLIGLGDGEQTNDTATQDIVISFGVKDVNADYQGYRDIANAIESTKQFLIKHLILDDRYQLKLPIKWVIPQDDIVYPYYFGAIIVTYEFFMGAPTNDYI